MIPKRSGVPVTPKKGLPASPMPPPPPPRDLSPSPWCLGTAPTPPAPHSAHLNSAGRLRRWPYGTATAVPHRSDGGSRTPGSHSWGWVIPPPQDAPTALGAPASQNQLSCHVHPPQGPPREGGSSPPTRARWEGRADVTVTGAITPPPGSCHPGGATHRTPQAASRRPPPKASSRHEPTR